MSFTDSVKVMQFYLQVNLQFQVEIPRDHTIQRIYQSTILVIHLHGINSQQQQY